MNVQVLTQKDFLYPAPLKKYLADNAPLSIFAIGNMDILQNKTLAVFSSAKCPGKIILQTYDLMKNIRESGITVISGFHSPMEQECFNILLKGKQPVIFSPARNIEGLRVKKEYIKPLEDGRLLILSPFSAREKRISLKRSVERNRFTAAIADAIFVPYAAIKSKTEKLCKDISAWKKPIYTLHAEANSNLCSLGAIPLKDFVKIEFKDNDFTYCS